MRYRLRNATTPANTPMQWDGPDGGSTDEILAGAIALLAVEGREARRNEATDAKDWEGRPMVELTWVKIERDRWEGCGRLSVAGVLEVERYIEVSNPYRLPGTDYRWAWLEVPLD